MSWIRSVRNIRNGKVINGLLVASLATLVIRVASKDTNELFPAGEEIFSIVADLAVAYCAAWIFNLLVVEVPHQRDRRLVLKAVVPLCHAVPRPVISLVKEMTKQTGGQVADPFELPSSETVKLMCAKIDPHHAANMVTPNGTPITWFQRFEDARGDVERSVDAIAPLFDRLDAELVLAVHAMPRFPLWKMTQMMLLTAASNTNMSVWDKQLIEVIEGAERVRAILKAVELEIA